MKRRNFLKNIVLFLAIVAIVSSFTLMSSFAATSEETAYKSELKSAGFPEIYLEKIWQMHTLHPNWKFEAYQTNLDWDAAVAAESSEGKNKVWISTTGSAATATRLYRSQSIGEYTSKYGYNYSYVIGDWSTGGGYTNATPMAVAYYMNPYTFIGNEITIMQFEKLSWDFGENLFDAESVIETMLTGTFMSKTRNSVNSNYVDDAGNITYKDSAGRTITTSQTFANAICYVAKTNNINPCYLTAKILGEVGTSGTGSTTGTHSSYPGYYNYLNIGATDSASGDAITKGLSTAKSNGWDTPQKSISGGAVVVAEKYIAVGQDTPYLQKFNVTPKSTYSHQYMTAVNGVVNTTYKTYDGYKKAGRLDAVRTFKIPVFKNMPTSLSNSIMLSGYTNVGTPNNDANIRENAGYDYKKVGTMSSDASSVTIYGGFRDQRVAWSSTYGHDATYYRMYNPLWYKIDGGYVCEDYVDPRATISLKVGGTTTFSYSLGSSSEKPRFMSQDTRIATIDSNGKITAHSYGTTRVVAYLYNGSFAVLTVNVAIDASGLPTAITSNAYSVNNGSSFISKIANGTTVGIFTSNLNEKNYVSVTKNGTALSSNNVITTGCVVSLVAGGQTLRTYTVVVTGDIATGSGVADGKISITDLLAIRDELLSSNGILSGANYKAADVNGDGKVSITDLLAIRDYLLGTSSITPRSY